MSDGKIHIPARRKQPVDDQMVVKVTPEAYNALVEIYNEYINCRECKREVKIKI